MQESVKKFSLVKPTVDTPFRIDFDWWQDTDSNWRIFLYDFLCKPHKEVFSDRNDSVKIDAVDPESAEVRQVDGLLFTLMNHCAQQENFIPDNLPLVGRIFRVFLANDNHPLNSKELAELVNKPARTILITIGGQRVYKGIRPLQIE